MTKASLISMRNLELAWMRISTGRNLQHKRMFRHLYNAYEPGRRPNLALLHEKLKGGWKATSPIRVYMPKASGLLRPLTLLSLDDQIVLQAVANQIAKQMGARRQAVERKVVFSNCLNHQPDSIFFLQDWRSTYHGFSDRLSRHLGSGNRWIAHFDLAAFYETISHRALQSIVSPAGGNSEIWEQIRDWFCVWTSAPGGIRVDHGIPQGPIASDFIAEAFLLPLDEAMLKLGIPYIRYVDDIRVLAKTENQVRRAAIVLETECRRWSLIPQSSKFIVSHANSLAEALGTLPSIAESTGRDLDENPLDETSAVSIFRSALSGRPLRVTDKSRLRYVLYRSGPSRQVLNLALKMLPHHPEHIDAFSAFFQNYGKSPAIMRSIKAWLQAGVLYDYVQGELWLIASTIGTADDLLELLPTARIQAKRRHLPFAMQRGLTAFLLSCRKAGVYSEFRALNSLRAKSPYIQSLLVPYLTDDDYVPGGVATEMLHLASPGPGIVLASEIVERGLLIAAMGLRAGRLAPEVRNVFQGLGLIEGGRRVRFDQIGDVLRHTYGVPYSRRWKSLLGANYQHALQLILSADNKFQSDRSGWLASQNSFNDALFRSFQAALNARRLPGALTTIYADGKLKTFGLLLDVNAAFARQFPDMATKLRATNERRNSIPDSHPFETKTGKQTRRLAVRERDALKAGLSDVYREVIAWMNAHSI